MACSSTALKIDQPVRRGSVVIPQFGQIEPNDVGLLDPRDSQIEAALGHAGRLRM
jgi:hypothetical protein